MPNLYRYQKEAVQDAVLKFGGRALLALDMGLGKTAVALSASDVLMSYPALVVAPACMVFQWRNEALTWTSLEEQDIHVVTRKDFPLHVKMLIVSYERATRYSLRLSEWQPRIVIVDESHNIKNKKAKRTKQLVPLCQQAPYCLLLTGTPVLNRPIELWSQLQALNVSFGNYEELGFRYCNGRLRRFGRRRIMDFKGSSRVSELRSSLQSSCMIRLTKKEIAEQLPSKRRTRVVLEGLSRPASLDELATIIHSALEKSNGNRETAWQALRSAPDAQSDCMFRAYRETADMKIAAVSQISVELSQEAPLVVFGHHKSLIDGVCAALGKAGVEYCRITGSESASQKQ